MKDIYCYIHKEKVENGKRPRSCHVFNSHLDCVNGDSFGRTCGGVTTRCFFTDCESCDDKFVCELGLM